MFVSTTVVEFVNVIIEFYGLSLSLQQFHSTPSPPPQQRVCPQNLVIQVVYFTHLYIHVYNFFISLHCRLSSSRVQTLLFLSLLILIFLRIFLPLLLIATS